MIPTSRVGRIVAVGYVVVVALLTARAFSDAHQDHWGAEIAAAVLTLPAVVVALPAIYLLGAAAWSVSDAGDGGPMWPVTLTFTLLMSVVACGNAAGFVFLSRVLRRKEPTCGTTR